MKCAIIGKIGSGKTTFCQILDKADKVVICADDFVNEFYGSNEGIEYVRSYFPEAVFYCGTLEYIDKEILTVLLLKNKEKRKKFEDGIAKILMKEVKRQEKLYGDIYVDGVLPKFIKEFDQVLYIERKRKDRMRDVTRNRKVMKEQFLKIEKLQKRMFPSFFEE